MQIDIDDVTKTFGSTVALDGVDLEIDDGERIGLVGPNGSGKTTLIRIVVGLIGRDGDVRVGGVDPFEERTEIASEVAYVPQIAPEFDVRVGPLTDTVCRARGIDREEVAALTDRLDFSIDEHADKPYRDLSGGMKQKMLIGLAVAGEPDLLVMDEPTASLDAETRSAFFRACAELDGPTLVLCSHRLEEIRHLVDAIVELEEGAVADVRSVGEFVETSGRAVVECAFAAGASPDADELEALGLDRVDEGVWSGVFGWDRKMEVVRRLMEDYGDEMEDFVVNEMTDETIVSA